MNIIITRILTKGEYTHGHLSIGGIRICGTLENANSCVPSGEYVITLLKCRQHARKMPCLNPNAPCTKCPKSRNSDPSSLNLTLPCWCPQLKPGNGVHNRLDGSILVGSYNSLGCLIHPQSIFGALYDRIRKSISRGHQVKLTVSCIK